MLKQARRGLGVALLRRPLLAAAPERAAINVDSPAFEYLSPVAYTGEEAKSILSHHLNENIVAMGLDVERGFAQTLFEDLGNLIDARRKFPVVLKAAVA